MHKVVFKIFIAGPSVRNKTTVEFCQSVCAELFVDKSFDVIIIDILNNPMAAEEKKVLATPTIIRDQPLPEKRIIGELKDQEVAKKAIEFLTEDLINN